jgi:prephenate dehydrogenase
VVGVDPDPSAALETGAIASAEPLERAVANADAVFVATPVPALAEAIGQALAAAPAGCVVTDTGSVKRPVVAAVDDERFVGGHPLAGAETDGVEHARGDLFDGATWYLTPTARTSGVLFERLHRFLVALGARPQAIDADLHDRLMATISHLPHVLANALVSQASALGEPAMGPSFRDATRVAGANPGLWPDILLANRAAVGAVVDDLRSRLDAVTDALQAGDREALEAWQREAQGQRGELLEAALHSGPHAELRLVVPNRPGVVAELSLALGRAGINIADMSLTPAPDFSRGEIALWVQADELDRARSITEGLF